MTSSLLVDLAHREKHANNSWKQSLMPQLMMIWLIDVLTRNNLWTSWLKEKTGTDVGWLETDKCIQVFQEKKGKLSSNRFGDSCYPEVMATSDGFPRAIVVSFVFFYFLVFGLSTIGNCLVLSICYRAIKRNASSLKWFIANLAIADLTFTCLSILDFIAFLWTWLGGQVTCKLQSFLIEACYTASIMTLVVISLERLKAVVDPFSTRTSAPEGVYRKLAGLWFVSFVGASPLLYAYQAHEDRAGGCPAQTLHLEI